MSSRPGASAGLAEGEVDAARAGGGVLAVLERRDAMKAQPRRAAPDEDVAVLERDAPGLVAAGVAAPQEGGRQAEGDGHDGLGEVPLVLVLVQGHLGAGGVAVDEAGVRGKARKAGAGGGIKGEALQERRHGGPGAVGVGIGAGVAVAAAVGDPAKLAAAGGAHRHGKAAGRDHVAEGRGGAHRVDGGEEGRGVGEGEAGQEYRARVDGDFGGRGEVVEEAGGGHVSASRSRRVRLRSRPQR